MNSITENQLVPLPLLKYVEKSIGDVKVLALNAGCDIINEVPSAVMVKALPAYLESIILNILTNAIKYRSPKRKSNIHIYAKFNNNMIQLIVMDNGLGIDLKLHGSKIFGMYKTFHGNNDAKGIGLFITKNQIDAMGGSIEVESKLNQGTTFKINFQNGKI
jgi:signal transduction histidine kinase